MWLNKKKIGKDAGKVVEAPCRRIQCTKEIQLDQAKILLPTQNWGF